MDCKIKPFCSAGEVFALPDGKVVAMPIAFVRLENGMTVFRVGDTTYWFNEDGTYDGPEMSLKSGNIKELTDLLEECKQNVGRLPVKLYFDESDTRRKIEIDLATTRNDVS